MTVVAPLTRLTLADRVVRQSLTSDVVLVAGGAVLTGILAQIAVPLWPVPITGQTLAVLLVGTTLGALRGALSMGLYALVGVLGVPWFSDASSGLGVIAGPTGGYVVGFVLAAGLTGALAERRWDRSLFGATVSLIAGSVIVFAVGLPWLAAVLALTFEQTLQAGLFPFIIGGLIKAALAAGIVRGAWAIADARSSRSLDQDTPRV